MKATMTLFAGLSLTLVGCGGATGTTGVRPGISATGMRPATNDQRGAATAHRGANPLPGEILGRDRAALITQFGQPRLDSAEGPATRLQFSSATCVLDAYLYPPRAGATAVVTHVDARTPEGTDTDRTACITALRRR